MHIAVACHQPLPAKGYGGPQRVVAALVRGLAALGHRLTLLAPPGTRLPEATVVVVPPRKLADAAALARGDDDQDRKSTRLNSSHVAISYAVFCLKKKNR